jgi:hypothetical protein
MKCAMKRDAPGKYMETEHATTAAIWLNAIGIKVTAFISSP